MKRAALYLRVSTARQAEKDLSIPDQQRQCEEYCGRKGWTVTKTFVEPGASATDDKRPVFQRMIDTALSPGPLFDVIVVHSFSRFFRDAVSSGMYQRRLEKRGVEVVSISQDLGNDPAGRMAKQMFALFDEFQSAENAKHVTRAMKENARQGFWNGSLPPYGYKAKGVAVRGDTVKKKLAINEVEATTVRTVFNLYEHGEDGSPMGLRAIAATLNRKGLRYRKSRPFDHNLVHQILTRTAYKGVQYFNRTDSKTRKRKPSEEWIEFATPAFIDPARFDRVQQQLRARSPAVTPPRLVSSPTLLTGIARCPLCRGGMTIRTGKGGRYRYYVCNAAATSAKTKCPGRSIRMDLLDDIVIDHLAQRVLAPGKVEELLAALIDRQKSSAESIRLRDRDLNKQQRAIEEKINRLLDAIADGTIGDRSLAKQKLSELEAQRDEAIRQRGLLPRWGDDVARRLTAANVARFTEAARARLKDPSKSLRKALVREFVDKIEVGEREIKIHGSKAALATAVASCGAREVPSSVPEWWAHQDSNLGPAD